MHLKKYYIYCLITNKTKKKGKKGERQKKKNEILHTRFIDSEGIRCYCWERESWNLDLREIMTIEPDIAIMPRQTIME